VDDILEDDWVDVLPKKIEKKPVSNIALANDGINTLLLHSSVSESEHESSDVGAEDDDDPVDDHQAGQEAQEQQPEPDKDVDLLVNYIERKNT